MRILFYLPVVTPWWFEHIILPLLEKLSVENEVRVLAPIFWQGTGLRQQEYDLCAHLPNIVWHVVNDKDHRTMRTQAAQHAQIVDFVRELNPDFVLCRSADLDTVAQFPGVICHITEGGAEPMPLPSCAIHFTKTPFDHGFLPPLESDQETALQRLIEPYWDAFSESVRPHPSQSLSLCDIAGIPDERPVVFLPLEYEHPENFFIQHRIGAVPNAKLVEETLEAIDGRATLVLTNHPLNDLHIDNSALEAVVDAHAGSAFLLAQEAVPGRSTTAMLMDEVDGVILGNSKCFSLAAFCGTPIVRRSHFQTGKWLNAHKDLDGFVRAILSGDAKRPAASKVPSWFAFHAANNLLFLKDPDLSSDQIIDRLTQPFDPGRWEKNFAMFASRWVQNEELAA